MHKALALLLFAVLTCSTAHAEQWKKYWQDEETQWYLDINSITPVSYGSRVFTIKNHKFQKRNSKNLPYFSSVIIFDINCSEFKYRLLSYVDNSGEMGSGTPYYELVSTPEWKYAMKDTINGLLLDIVCRR